MTRVVFLRDPFERVLSTYYNSDTNKYIKIPHCDNWHQCGIDTWVDYIYRQPNTAFTNEHFLPQNKVAQMQIMHYNYIFRMSSKSDQNFFWDNIVKMEAFGINQSSNSKSNSNSTLSTPSLQSMQEKVKNKFAKIPNHTIAQMATLYKEDIKLWEMALEKGSEKDPNKEYTMYDYYKEFLEHDLRIKEEYVYW